jgi:hypothetical protein
LKLNPVSIEKEAISYGGGVSLESVAGVGISLTETEPVEEGREVSSLRGQDSVRRARVMEAATRKIRSLMRAGLKPNRPLQGIELSPTAAPPRGSRTYPR